MIRAMGVGLTRNTALAANAGDLLDQATRRLLGSHLLHRSACNVDEAEIVYFLETDSAYHFNKLGSGKVSYHLLPNLVLAQAFELACKTVASIVDDDIEPAEC